MGFFSATFAADRIAMSKALDLLPSEPTLLTKGFYTDPLRDNAHPLGVGWNKVESVRGWLRASGLIMTDNKGRSGKWQLTPLGELIATQDLSLRKQLTWWTIHTQLATNKDASVYYYLFSEAASKPFTWPEASLCIVACLGKDAVRKSVDDDLQAIRSSLHPGKTKLANLGLLVADGERWTRGTAEGMTLASLAYAIFTLRERFFSDAEGGSPAASMSLKVLTDMPGGLRSIFGYGLADLRAPVRRLSNEVAASGFGFSETAGLDSVAFGRLDALTVAQRGYSGDLHEDIVI